MNDVILKIHVIYTSVMAGMMLMYFITIGSYFDYILKHEMFRAFQDYSLFRKNTKVQRNHAIVMIGQVLLSVISLFVNGDRGWMPLLFAVLVPVIMLVFHLLTGFGKVENLVNSAEKLDEKTIKTYLMWNLPLHFLYTLLYLVSAFYLFSLL